MTAQANQAQDNPQQGYGTQIDFSSLSEPGCYVSNQIGHLIRVPEDALKPGRSPAISISGKNKWIVTKISNDPYTSVTKARMLAADLDLNVNF